MRLLNWILHFRKLIKGSQLQNFTNPKNHQDGPQIVRSTIIPLAMSYKVKIRHVRQTLHQTVRESYRPKKCSSSYNSKLDSARPNKCRLLVNADMMCVCNDMQQS